MKLILEEVIARTPEVIRQVRSVLPVGFPARLADAILEGTNSRAEQLKMEWSG